MLCILCNKSFTSGSHPYRNSYNLPKDYICINCHRSHLILIDCIRKFNGGNFNGLINTLRHDIDKDGASDEIIYRKYFSKCLGIKLCKLQSHTKSDHIFDAVSIKPGDSNFYSGTKLIKQPYTITYDCLVEFKKSLWVAETLFNKKGLFINSHKYYWARPYMIGFDHFNDKYIKQFVFTNVYFVYIDSLFHVWSCDMRRIINGIDIDKTILLDTIKGDDGKPEPGFYIQRNFWVQLPIQFTDDEKITITNYHKKKK